MWRFYLIVTAVAAVVGFLGWTAIKAFPESYTEMARKTQRLEHQLKLKEAEIISKNRMVARRDAAIKASACKAQIEYWVRHPDNIPKAFNPFDQLTAPNLREGVDPPPPPAYDDWEPSGPLTWNWSKLNPFNWF